MTIKEIIKRMVLLKQRDGKTLLPCGGFTEYFPKYVSVDPHQFFDYPVYNEFNSIVGIPHCLSYKHIINKDKLQGHGRNTNLYVFYIDKCLKHLGRNGELIVHTPSDFLKNSPVLNQKIYQMGTITDVIHTGKAGQIIWRFAKDNFSYKTLVDGHWNNFISMNDQLMFLNNDYSIPFTDLFTIRVGAISGFDEAFVSERGNIEFVTAKTPQTGLLKKVFFNEKDCSLVKHKEKLLGRKIKKFNEENWWTWGRNHYISDEPRVYVPCRTRNAHPFFHHECKNYDSSVLAIFFKGRVKPGRIVNLLNKVDWNELGFKTGKRFVFSQKSLENIRLPKDFSTYIANSRCKTPCRDVGKQIV